MPYIAFALPHSLLGLWPRSKDLIRLILSSTYNSMGPRDAGSAHDRTDFLILVSILSAFLRNRFKFHNISSLATAIYRSAYTSAGILCAVLGSIIAIVKPNSEAILAVPNSLCGLLVRDTNKNKKLKGG
jgi:hypothetical protein